MTAVASCHLPSTPNVLRLCLQPASSATRLYIDMVARFAWTAFGDLVTFFDKATLMTLDCYFPTQDHDTDDIVAHVFAVVTDLVPLPSTMPTCPKCCKATAFKANNNVPFGWEIRCVDRRMLSRQEARHLHVSRRLFCTGAEQATHNTWFENVRSISRCLGLTFCWLNNLAVTRASMTVGCSDHTAVDHYSVTRDVCEVIMSNEVLSRKFGGEGVVVEVDECYLTRRKYHKGRRMRGETITLLGVYERDTKLGFHVQVRDRSSAVLLSEIRRFVEPGTHIMSDGLASYRNLPASGYYHGVVIHDNEFVDSFDPTIHTQNIEIRNRWTKAAVKSYGSNRPLNSYISEYTYRSTKRFIEEEPVDAMQLCVSTWSELETSRHDTRREYIIHRLIMVQPPPHTNCMAPLLYVEIPEVTVYLATNAPCLVNVPQLWVSGMCRTHGFGVGPPPGSLPFHPPPPPPRCDRATAPAPTPTPVTSTTSSPTSPPPYDVAVGDAVIVINEDADEDVDMEYEDDDDFDSVQ